ncbi:unnamed protein product, partial [marine sediment metagenome]
PQLEMVIFPKTWMVVVLTLCVGIIIGTIPFITFCKNEEKPNITSPS